MNNKINDNWYEDFFKGINCELWEKAVSPEWTNEEAAFLQSELKMNAGQRLLDIPCGNGRLSIAMAKRGYHVTGIDISDTFINGLKNKIKSEKLSINVIHEDILMAHLEKGYSGAICMGNSFGYFSFDKIKLFVEKVSACLETGSRFIINSGMIAESILPNFSKSESFTVENIKMDITNTYCADGSYMISDILYTKEDRKEEHSFKHYVFTLGEVKRLLHSYGLETIATYNSPSKAAYIMGDHQIYIVAEKC